MVYVTKLIGFSVFDRPEDFLKTSQPDCSIVCFRPSCYREVIKKGS
jgi:hypothetical protein